jgi:hypothetical protein
MILYLPANAKGNMGRPPAREGLETAARRQTQEAAAQRKRT